MTILSILIIALSLAMDAFAVSVCNGIAIKQIKPKKALVFGLYFGGFQFIMPIIGFALASLVANYIGDFGSYVSFAILSVIGCKAFWETFKAEDALPLPELKIFAPKRLTMLAIATSIDALAVGVTLRLEGDTHILFNSAIIGVVALSLSFFGVYLGKRLGSLFRKNAERIAGIALVAIGIKILVQAVV